MDRYCVAVIKWWKNDGIAEAIFSSLQQLGHQPIYFLQEEEIPTNVNIVITFGPYGRLLPILYKVTSLPRDIRPLLVHWDTEGIPNPNIPWLVLKYMGGFLSWSERVSDSRNPKLRYLFSHSAISRILKTGFRIRLDGHYHYAYQRGLINIFIETSQIYAKINTMHGLPTHYVPWGTHSTWYTDLGLERDIDVLWIGSRRSRRRNILIQKIKEELMLKGYNMHIIDGVENPAVFDDERNRIFNRAKITLNLLPAWYFNSFTFRYHLAAGNRTLVVSEPILPHCLSYHPGENYVSSKVHNLVDTLLFYLNNPKDREEIVERAYQLVTQEMTFTNSVKMIMDSAINYMSSLELGLK